MDDRKCMSPSQGISDRHQEFTSFVGRWPVIFPVFTGTHLPLTDLIADGCCLVLLVLPSPCWLHSSLYLPDKTLGCQYPLNCSFLSFDLSSFHTSPLLPLPRKFHLIFNWQSTVDCCYWLQPSLETVSFINFKHHGHPAASSHHPIPFSHLLASPFLWLWDFGHKTKSINSPNLKAQKLLAVISETFALSCLSLSLWVVFLYRSIEKRPRPGRLCYRSPPLVLARGFDIVHTLYKILSLAQQTHLQSDVMQPAGSSEGRGGSALSQIL